MVMVRGPKAGTIEKGKSGNPGGVSKKEMAAEVKQLARKHTSEAIQMLRDLADAVSTPPAVRVSALQALLDRGHGKATQHVDIAQHPLDRLSPEQQQRLLGLLDSLAPNNGDGPRGAEPGAENGTGEGTPTTH